MRNFLPPKLTAYISIYIIFTGILYNNFFNLNISSRLPQLAVAFFLVPIASFFLCKLKKNRSSFYPSFTIFLSFYLLIEIFHNGFGSTEIVSIVAIISMLAFFVVTSSYNKDQLVWALMVSCLLYIIFIYPIAMFHGMVGNSISDAGVFVSQYIPSLSALTMNGSFQSGRGVIGMIGAVLAIGAIVHMRNGSVNTSHLIFLAVGISALMISDSRGPIISFCIILFALLTPISKKLRVKLVFVLPPIIILLQGLIILANGSFDFISELGFMSRQNMDTSDLARVAVWAESLRMLMDAPQFTIFGYGAVGAENAMNLAFGQYHPDIEQLTSAHNLLLQILLDGGVVLMLPFLFYIGRITLYGYKYARYIKFQDLDTPAILSFILLSGISGSVISVNRINESMFLVILICAALDKQIQSHASKFRSIPLKNIVCSSVY